MTFHQFLRDEARDSRALFGDVADAPVEAFADYADDLDPCERASIASLTTLDDDFASWLRGR